MSDPNKIEFQHSTLISATGTATSSGVPPEATRVGRVRSIAKEWMDTFVDKNSDYGSSYQLSGKTLDLWFPQGFIINTPEKQIFFGLLTRMLDKIIRTSNLVLRGNTARVKDEKAYQTIADLGVYAFMTADLLLNGAPDDQAATGSNDRGVDRSR